MKRKLIFAVVIVGLVGGAAFAADTQKVTLNVSGAF